MGRHSVKVSGSALERKTFLKHLLNDVEALDRMLQEGMIESGISRIGAEQEFCLVAPLRLTGGEESSIHFVPLRFTKLFD